MECKGKLLGGHHLQVGLQARIEANAGFLCPMRRDFLHRILLDKPVHDRLRISRGHDKVLSRPPSLSIGAGYPRPPLVRPVISLAGLQESVLHFARIPPVVALSIGRAIGYTAKDLFTIFYQIL